MRVCLVSFEYPPNIIGGAGIYAEAIANGLKLRGVDVYVITRGRRNDCEQKTFRIPSSNVNYWRRLFFMKPAMSLLRKLDKLLNFDLVHFNESLITLGRNNIPSVCTMHSAQFNELTLRLANLRTLKTAKDIQDLVLKGPVGSMFDVFRTRMTDKIICPSYHLARLIRSYCHVNDKKICVIPNGIDLKAFDRVKGRNDDVLSKYNLEKDNYLLFVGRLFFFKGVQFLIEAFRTMKEDCSNLKLAIVGTGDFENSLRNLAHGRKDIVFTGYVDSLRVKKTLYENSLFVVVPSIYETLPLVVLEAMACGKAVIASDVGGVPMLVRHGKNGFLVKPGDLKNLEKSIRVLYECGDLRENMGSFSRKLVEKQFTIDKMVDKTLEVYETLC